jgi:hypothetical protein
MNLSSAYKRAFVQGLSDGLMGHQDENDPVAPLTKMLNQVAEAGKDNQDPPEPVDPPLPKGTETKPTFDSDFHRVGLTAPNVLQLEARWPVDTSV